MSTSNQRDLARANDQYAKNFTDGDLPIPPSRKYLIGKPISDLTIISARFIGQHNTVTCMDSRIDTFYAFGIKLGEAHIIRNAGGNARDALRSILISQHFLGTREIVLIKHTGCGMLTFTNDKAFEKIEERCGAGVLDKGFDFQPYPNTEEAVKSDVDWLRGNKALVEGTTVSGWIYEVETGHARRVDGA